MKSKSISVASVVESLQKNLDNLDEYRGEKHVEDELYEESEEAERIESACERISDAIELLREK